MKLFLNTTLTLLLALSAWAAENPDNEKGWIGLFDGKTFNGWQVGKNAESFKIQDGVIVVNGNVAHLFYVGDVAQHQFKNFHFKADVMTFPNANSGIYFHTKYQEEGFPKFGIECQVNNSHRDPKRTGSLWGIKDNLEVPAKDNVWFCEEIIVRGLHIVIKVDGKTVVDFTLSEAATGENQLPTHNTWLPQGTFALQGHDPGSKVCFKNIRVKILE